MEIMQNVRLTGKSTMVMPAPSLNHYLSKLTPIEELAYQIWEPSVFSRRPNSLAVIQPKIRRVHEDGFAMLEKKFTEKDATQKLISMQNRVKRL